MQDRDLKREIKAAPHLSADSLLNLNETVARDIFEGITYPWEALPRIKDFIRELGERLSKDEYYEKEDGIWIAKSAKIAPTAYIAGPAIIGRESEVRHCAFIRGSAIVGENAVVGNSTELKNVILFNNVQVPHYNYVGDSILGFHAHLGAGAITSNVKADRLNVSVKTGGAAIETGLRKFGAIIGDYAEIGCGAVLNPGTVVGKNSVIYPLSMVRGYVPEESIYKKQGEIVRKEIRS